MRILLGILPDVYRANALTECLIASGCAAHTIFLLMARRSPVAPEHDALLVSIGEHLDLCVCCVGDPTTYTQPVFDRVAQRQRCVQLIDCFAKHYPNDWQFHQNLVKGGSPVGVVHLEALCHDEPTIARTVLAHAVTRLQISDLPQMCCAD